MSNEWTKLSCLNTHQGWQMVSLVKLRHTVLIYLCIGLFIKQTNKQMDMGENINSLAEVREHLKTKNYDEMLIGTTEGN